MRLPVACVMAFVSLCTPPVGGMASAPDIVDLASAYVHRFFDDYANIVAEERYNQDATSPRRQRTLRSDFLLVRYPGASQWHVFRDVIEVDGKPAGEHREGRLLALFLDSADDALRRAQEIATTAARLNIQDIGTINNPLLAIGFLQRDYRDRFRFTPSKLERSLGPTVRIVQFEEVRIPTLLRRGGNLDLPASGRMWIDEATGRIVKTELRLGARDFVRGSMAWRPPSTVTTVFGFDDALKIDVPIEMRDQYSLENVDIKGVATYSRFRRFELRTAERRR
jgi:hypothetical protein